MSRLIKIGLLLGVIVAAFYLAAGYFADRRLRTGIDEAITHLPPGYTASYGAVHYNFVTGRGVVRDIVIKRTIAPAVSARIAVLRISHPNWRLGDSWAQAVSKQAASSPGAAVPVARAISISGLAATSDHFDAALDDTEIEGLRLYPWALLRPGLPTIQDALAAMARGPRQLQDLQIVLRLESAGLLGIGWDRDTIDGLHGKVIIAASPAMEKTQAEPERSIDYAVRHAQSEAVDRGIFGSISAIGYKFDSGLMGGGSIKRVYLEQVDVHAPAMKLIAGDPLDAALLDSLRIGRMGYEGIQVLRAGRPPVTVSSVVLSNIAGRKRALSSADFSVQALKLPADAVDDPRMSRFYEWTGLKSATISLNLGYRWNLKEKQGTLHDAALTIDELGSMNLEGTADDLVPGGGLAGAMLAQATLRYKDAGLANQLLAYGAKQLATDKEGMRNIAMNAVAGTADANQNALRLRAAAEQLVAFIKAPHTLTVILDPAEPVPFAGLWLLWQTPAQAAQLLGLSVTANASQ